MAKTVTYPRTIELPDGAIRTYYGEATTSFTYSRVGRTQHRVHCCCGQENLFYLWSWAGHGKAKCKGCSRWIAYWGREVFDETVPTKVSKPK
jgi:hypothetical protein